MPGIEDFVVEQILQDFQQTPQAPMNGAPGWEDQSSFMQDARAAGQLRQTGLPPGGVINRGQLEIADPALRSQYAQQEGRLAASAAGGATMDRALRERDAQRFKIMEGLRGLDPQIQATVLRRLGIDPGVVKSKLDQQKELFRMKEEAEAPQREIANALKMLLATQAGQRNAADLAIKQRSMEQEAASREQTRNIQLMRVLATLMQADQTGKLQTSLAPILLQMLQGSGINIAQPSSAPSAPSAKGSGIKITREP